MKYGVMIILCLALANPPTFAANVVDLGLLPSMGSVSGNLPLTGAWTGLPSTRGATFQVADATRLTVNVTGYSGNYMSVYDVLPEDWWLSTSSSWPTTTYSGSGSDWSVSTHIEGSAVPIVSGTGDPISEETLHFSLTTPGIVHIDSYSYDTNDPWQLRDLGIDIPSRTDAYWDVTVTDATVSNILPSIVIAPGEYEFLFQETLPTYGRYVDYSRGISLTTNPVPIPGALWMFGSGLLAAIGISRRRKAYY